MTKPIKRFHYYLRDTGVWVEMLLGTKTIDQSVKQDIMCIITVHQC